MLFGESYRTSLATVFPRFLKAMAHYHEGDIKASLKDTFGFEGGVADSADNATVNPVRKGNPAHPPCHLKSR